MNRDTNNLPFELTALHNQQSDAPAELIRAEASASDDRLETDRYSPHVSTLQEEAPDATPKYSEADRRALAECYTLLLNLARDKDADLATSSRDAPELDEEVQP